VLVGGTRRLAKFDAADKTKIQGFRENLKSTGQSKFTIDEKEETAVCRHNSYSANTSHACFSDSLINHTTVLCSDLYPTARKLRPK